MSQVRAFRLVLFGFIGLAVTMLLLPQTRWVVPAWTVDPAPSEARHRPVTNTPEGALVAALFRQPDGTRSDQLQAQLAAANALGTAGRGVLARNLHMGLNTGPLSPGATELARQQWRVRDEETRLRAEFLLSLTERGERDDSGNAFWALRRAVALMRLGRTKEAEAAVIRASQGQRYDNFADEEMRMRTLADPGELGIAPGAYSKVMHGASVLLPDYADIRRVLFLTLRGKGLEDSLEMRLAWARIGERMVNHHSADIGQFVGLALISEARLKIAKEADGMPDLESDAPRFTVAEMTAAQRAAGREAVPTFATAEAVRAQLRAAQKELPDLPLWEVPYATGLSLGVLPLATVLVGSTLLTLLISAYLPLKPGVRQGCKWGLGLAVLLWLEPAWEWARYSSSVIVVAALFYGVIAVGIRRVPHSTAISFGAVIVGSLVGALAYPELGTWAGLLGVLVVAALALHDQDEHDVPRWRVVVEVGLIFAFFAAAVAAASLLALPGSALGPMFEPQTSLGQWSGRLAVGGGVLGLALAHAELNVVYRRAMTVIAAGAVMLLVGAGASATVEEYARRTLSLFEQGDSRYREFWKQEEARAR